MLGLFRRGRGSSANDDNPLSALEERLFTLIPRRVKALRLGDPVYCLRVWYYGTDTEGDRVPSLTLCPDAARRIVLAEKGDKAPHYLWCADELCIGRVDTSIDDAALAALCRRWYSHIPPGLPETEQLRPIREMVQRVAARLNRVEWESYVPVTDDFVVFAADASHTFCADYEEMLASVPADRVELLRLRRMLGTHDWYTLGTLSEDES